MALFAAHVHAFEPMAFCIEALKSNRAVNPHLNITVHEGWDDWEKPKKGLQISLPSSSLPHVSVALFSEDGPLPFSGQDGVNGGPNLGGQETSFKVTGAAAMPYLRRIMPNGFGDIGFIKVRGEVASVDRGVRFWHGVSALA